MSTFLGGRVQDPFGTIGTLRFMNVTQQTFMESFSAQGITYQIGDVTLSLGGQFKLTAGGVSGQVTGFFLQKLVNSELTELGASFDSLSLAVVEARFDQAFNLQAVLELFPGDSQIILLD